VKVLIANKYLYRGGGTATYLLALMDELRDLGHDIVPFTVAFEGTQTTAYSEYYVSPPGRPGQTHYADLLSAPVSLAKLAGRAIYSTETFRKAIRLVDATGPDVAYVNNIYNYMSPSIFRALKQRGVPIVMGVADFNLVCPGLYVVRNGVHCRLCASGAHWKALAHRCHKGSLAATSVRVLSMYAHRWLRLYDLVDAFVTPSRVLRDLLIESGLPATKVRQIPLFYRPPAASATSNADLPQFPAADALPYVMYFGRIDRYKGIETLVRAFAQCRRGVRLLIVGADVDGERQRLSRIADEIGVANVEFLGNQGRAELDVLIRGALFTVIPSEMPDNCPMCVLESFAHAKPVIGSNIGGIPEQITPEVGYLFEPGNVGELADRIQSLIDDAALRETMGAAALHRLRTVFSPEAHCEALLELFAKVIQRSARRL
jgi:glycosyltransferase involved in cell wall biosynthesis